MVQSSCHGLQESFADTSMPQPKQISFQYLGLMTYLIKLDISPHLILPLDTGKYHAPRLSSQDCVHNFPWTLWVQSNALWVNQCSRSVSTLDAACAYGIKSTRRTWNGDSLHKRCPSTLDEHLQHLQSVLHSSVTSLGRKWNILGISSLQMDLRQTPYLWKQL